MGDEIPVISLKVRSAKRKFMIGIGMTLIGFFPLILLHLYNIGLIDDAIIPKEPFTPPRMLVFFFALFCPGLIIMGVINLITSIPNLFRELSVHPALGKVQLQEFKGRERISLQKPNKTLSSQAVAEKRWWVSKVDYIGDHQFECPNCGFKGCIQPYDEQSVIMGKFTKNHCCMCYWNHGIGRSESISGTAGISIFLDNSCSVCKSKSPMGKAEQLQ